MLVGDRYTRFVAERVKSPPLTSGDTLYWDGIRTTSQGVGRAPVVESVTPAAWLAPPLAIASRASPVGSTRSPDRRLAPPAPVIEWATEAAALSVYLPPCLLLSPVDGLLPGATGELIWVPWQHTTALLPLAVHPALLVQTAAAPLQGACVELVLGLPLPDPLHQHIALVLQATSTAADVAGQLYAETLTDALVVHFLRRYAAAQSVLSEATGGLTPYKLQRIIAYIQTHLEEPVSLSTLAAVAQISLTHFAHLFKQATGLAPHQYVVQCRIEEAKRLLAKTDLSLMDIVVQIGCADHSHFSALFRKHVAMTPRAYRNHARGQFM